MRILFVSALFNPLDKPINGDAQRTQLLLRACATIAAVDVVTFAGKNKEDAMALDGVKVVFDKKVLDVKRPIGRFKKWSFLLPWTGIQSLFSVNPNYESVLDGIIQTGGYDFIVTRYFPRAVYCGLWKYRDKLVVDFDDALPFFFLNQIEPNSALSTKVRLKLSAKRAKAISRHAVREMHAAFYAEESTAEANQGIFLPNIPFYEDNCSDADMNVSIKRILFVGQLEYPPNKEGLDHFLEYVYRPLIERMPNVEMHVVGLIKDKALCRRWQSYPGVTVTGFVADLKQEYEQCHVVVVPVYRCGATNIKLLEAMAMNRACVTTVEAQTKLNRWFENGGDLIAAADDMHFVDALTTVLTDEEENHRIAQNGKIVMDRYYSFDAFREIVKTALD